MPGSISLYNLLPGMLMAGDLDPYANDFRLALVDDSYVFDAAGEAWSEVSAAEISGTGYTAGGALVPDILNVSVTNGRALEAGNVTWAALTATFRAAVLYVDATIDGVVKPTLAYIVFDATPADVAVSGVDFVVKWTGGQIYTVTRAV